MLARVQQWANAVREWEEEQGIPDLWTLAKAPRLSTLQESPDNAPFTPEQQTEIATRIGQVKALIRKSFELEAAQLEGIDQKLDDLVEASRRVGSKDWRVMLYGAAFGMIVNDAVSPGVVHGVLGMVVHGLAHIFGLAGPPPVISA